MPSDLPRKSLTERCFPHPLLSAVLIAIWLLLMNEVSLGGLIMAVLLSIIVPIISSSFWPGRPSIRAYGRVVFFLLLVAWDVMVASFQVARLILFTPVNKLRPCWIAVPITLTSPEAISVLAGTITMTPGTVSCDLSSDGRFLLVHCLDSSDPEAEVYTIQERYETRLKRIFP